MPTVQQIAKDPKFYELPFEERRKVFLTVDPNFGSLVAEEQTKVLKTLETSFQSKPKPSQPRLDVIEGSLFDLTPDVPSEEYRTMLPGKSMTADQIKREVSSIYHPLLEGGGMVAGGIIGAGAGAPSGPGAALTGVAGGTLGYAIGKGSADRLDEWLKIKAAPTLKELVTETGKDLRTGLTYEMGGQIIGPAAMTIKRGGGAVYDLLVNWGAKTMTKKGAEQAAGRIIVAHTSSGPIYADNAHAAAAIEKEIPGLKFSFGQKTGDPNVIKLERAKVRGTREGAEKYMENIENNTEAMQKYFNKHFVGDESADDMVAHFNSIQNRLNKNVVTESEKVANLVGKLPSETPQATGVRLIDKIEKAKEPVKKAMGELESNIPDYAMKFDETRNVILEILKDKKLSVDQVKAVKTFQKNFLAKAKHGESTHNAFGIRRTLNDDIEKYFASGKDSSGTVLLKVRNALEADLAKVSELSRTGKIAEYGGKTVIPDELAAELEKNSQRIARVNAEQTPDVTKMAKELNEMGSPVMQVPKEAKDAYVKRLSNDYTRLTGKEAPITASANKGEVKRLTQRNEDIKKILGKVEPGKDVASAMRAYNDYASTQYFGRFDVGATKRTTTRGRESFGTSTMVENIPAQFSTASGAEDLITAIGRAGAKKVMHGHFTYDMMQNATNRATGAVDAKRLSNWLSKNKIVLQKFQLYNKFNDILKTQGLADDAILYVKEFEKSIAGKVLKADPERAIVVAMSGANSGKAAQELMSIIGNNQVARLGLKNSLTEHIDKVMQKITTMNKLDVTLKKFMPAIKVLYKNEPSKIRALVTMQKAYKSVLRNKKSALGFGSDTAENILTQLGSVNVLNRTANISRALIRTISKYGDDKANAMITRALFDPDYAKVLIDGARFNIKPKELKTVINSKIIQLDAYRVRRLSQAVAGAGVATKSVVDNGSAD